MNRQVVILISLLLILVLGVGFVSPKYQQFKALREEIEEKTKELQSQEEYFSNLLKISDKFSEYETELSKIDSVLPEDPGLPALFSFIQKTTSQSGLVLKGITPAGSKMSQSVEDIQETELVLIVSGPYSSFKNFLSVLEKTSRLIEVDSISFSSSLEKGASINYNLRIRVYSY